MPITKDSTIAEAPQRAPRDLKITAALPSRRTWDKASQLVAAGRVFWPELPIANGCSFFVRLNSRELKTPATSAQS